MELEHCPAGKGNARERYWIGYYLTRSDLLNRNLTGVTTIGQDPKTTTSHSPTPPELDR